MVGVEGVSKVWLRGSWLQLEFDTHRSYFMTQPYANTYSELLLAFFTSDCFPIGLQHWPGDS